MKHWILYLLIIPICDCSIFRTNIKQIFSPNKFTYISVDQYSKEEIIKAKRIIDQFNASDTGLVVIDGKLIEKPVLREMKRRILVADKINQWVYF